MTGTPKHASHAQGQDHSLASFAAEQPASALSAARSSYEEYRRYERNSWQPATHASKKKKMGLGKKVALALLAVLVLFGVGLGAYIWNLNNQIALSSSERDLVISELADTKADEPFYILCLGSDKRELSNKSERSDVMMLVRVDVKNKLVTMLSIPRDTPYVFEDGEVRKINRAYSEGGAAGALKAVAGLTGLPISHYAELHISDFQALIDDIGGIDVEVPTDLKVKDTLTGEWITLEAGVQHINGQQAQILARDRKHYTEGDVTRQDMNRQIIMAIVYSILSRPIQEIPGTLMAVASHIETDLSIMDIMGLMRAMGTDYSGITFYSATGPTDGGTRADLSDQWFCYENPEGWKMIVAAVDAGEDPSAIDVSEYAIIPEEQQE